MFGVLCIWWCLLLSLMFLLFFCRETPRLACAAERRLCHFSLLSFSSSLQTTSTHRSRNGATDEVFQRLRPNWPWAILPDLWRTPTVHGTIRTSTHPFWWLWWCQYRVSGALCIGLRIFSFRWGSTNVPTANAVYSPWVWRLWSRILCEPNSQSIDASHSTWVWRLRGRSPETLSFCFGCPFFLHFVRSVHRE